MSEPKVYAELFDFGRWIGVAVEFHGERKAVRVENPLWEKIDADWKRRHSAN